MLRRFGTRIEGTLMGTARSSSTILILALLAVVALLAGCAPTSGALGTPSTPTPTGNASVVPPSGDATPGPAATASASAGPQSAAPSTPPTTSTPSPSGTTVVRAYFILGSGLVPVLREIPATAGVATAAMRALIAGPDAAELAGRPAMASDVPASTRLLGLSIAGGVATVDLSGEFATGLNAAQPDARLAQVVFTLTQFSTVERVSFQLDGQPVVGWPGARAGNTAQLPAIFVDRPAWGAAAGNPVRVTGLANVFEATFRVQLEDAAGKVVADGQVMASCGTGCWGSFSTTLAYTVGKAQWGTLRVFDLSAKDGTPENVSEYPVWLTPAG
jgi:germination protein M